MGERSLRVEEADKEGRGDEEISENLEGRSRWGNERRGQTTGEVPV